FMTHVHLQSKEDSDKVPRTGRLTGKPLQIARDAVLPFYL
ncbi:hypothetical protein KIPB_013870, partial [Kipferlia bialata]